VFFCAVFLLQFFVSPRPCFSAGVMPQKSATLAIRHLTEGSEAIDFVLRQPEFPSLSRALSGLVLRTLLVCFGIAVQARQPVQI